MDLVEFGKKIRLWRRGRGISQTQLADAADLSRSTVNQLESGIIRDLGIRKVQAVLEQIGLELSLGQAPRRRRPNFLRLASTAASVSFKTALSERQLQTALLTGRVPADRASHIRVLLEEAAPALIKGLIEQMGRRTQPAKLQRNLGKLATAVGLSQVPSQWLTGG